jgi:hypothetical protein
MPSNTILASALGEEKNVNDSINTKSNPSDGIVDIIRPLKHREMDIKTLELRNSLKAPNPQNTLY